MFEDIRIDDVHLLSYLREASITSSNLIYDFLLTLQDGEEIAGEITEERDLDEFELEYTIKLVHKPQKTTEKLK